MTPLSHCPSFSILKPISLCSIIFSTNEHKNFYNIYLYFISVFFFFLETKKGVFMVILHPRAESQHRDQLNKAQPSTVWGGQPSLSMLTNGLLRAAEIELRCGAQSERTLPTQPSPHWLYQLSWQVELMYFISVVIISTSPVLLDTESKPDSQMRINKNLSKYI